MQDSLRRNSSLLILSQAINAVAAFMFWIICAHLFKAREVGLATAFIAFGGLVSTFTNLGLPSTVVRFLPTSKRRGGLFTGSLSLVVALSLIGGGIGLLIIKHAAPKLAFVESSPLLAVILIALVVGTAVSALMDGVLMAFRKGEYILGKALLINVPRVVAPFLFVASGLRGIVGTYVVVFAFGITYNVSLVLRNLLKGQSLRPNMGEVLKHSGYAAGNYFGGMFGVLPSTLVPIIVLDKLGPVAAAYFYMPMQIATFLSVIASSTSSALISEASQEDDETVHRVHFLNAFRHTFTMLIPAVCCIGVLAWPLLRLYGKNYAEHGLVPLAILAVASLFVAINWLGDTWLNIKKRNRAYFLMNAFNALAVVLTVALFARYGLIAVAFGWLIAQVVSAAVYLLIFARGQLLGSAGRFNTWT